MGGLLPEEYQQKEDRAPEQTLYTCCNAQVQSLQGAANSAGIYENLGITAGLPGIKAEGSLSIIWEWAGCLGGWRLFIGITLKNKCKTFNSSSGFDRNYVKVQGTWN